MMNRRQFAAAASAAIVRAQSRAPNILMLFPDQQRPDWTGLGDRHDVRMPNLGALARRGTRFTNAIVPSPLCAPSRACIAGGREYARCGVPNNKADYPLDQPAFYAALRQSGYYVAGCGKLDLHKKTEDWGLDGKRMMKEWGFTDGVDNAGKFDAIRSGHESPKDPYMAFLHQRKLAAAHVADFRRRQKNGYPDTAPTPLPDDAYCDNWIAANGLRLLDQAPQGRPWFLVVNFTGPHNPMDITRSMEPGCRGRSYPQPNRSSQHDAATHTAIRQNYTAMVENIDRHVGEILDRVRQRGELDNTIVVYSSDHGEMLGDHNRWGKTVPYQASAGVPLVVAGPGVEKNRRVDAPVSLVDLAATFLDYAGAAAPSGMDSRSMRPLWEGRTKRLRESVRSGLGSWRLAFDGRYKLVHGFVPEQRNYGEIDPRAARAAPLLFDLDEDPRENVNLAAKKPRVVSRLTAAL